MSLIAVREFDMYGDKPELAALISKVQRLVEERLAPCGRAFSLR
jgi:hypothetical protein